MDRSHPAFSIQYADLKVTPFTLLWTQTLIGLTVTYKLAS